MKERTFTLWPSWRIWNKADEEPQRALLYTAKLSASRADSAAPKDYAGINALADSVVNATSVDDFTRRMERAFDFPPESDTYWDPMRRAQRWRDIRDGCAMPGLVRLAGTSDVLPVGNPAEAIGRAVAEITYRALSSDIRRAKERVLSDLEAISAVRVEGDDYPSCASAIARANRVGDSFAPRLVLGEMSPYQPGGSGGDYVRKRVYELGLLQSLSVRSSLTSLAGSAEPVVWQAPAMGGTLKERAEIAISAMARNKRQLLDLCEGVGRALDLGEYYSAERIAQQAQSLPKGVALCTVEFERSFERDFPEQWALVQYGRGTAPIRTAQSTGGIH